MRRGQMLFWGALAAASGLAAADVLPFGYVVAIAAGGLIWRLGAASFASLRSVPAFLPQGGPQPVDPAVERVVYVCEGCGAQVLLLMRGTRVPPRHCGERMAERRETTDALS